MQPKCHPLSTAPLGARVLTKGPCFSIPQSRNQAANLGGSVHSPGLQLADTGAEVRAAGRGAGEGDVAGCGVEAGAGGEVSRREGWVGPCPAGDTGVTVGALHCTTPLPSPVGIAVNAEMGNMLVVSLKDESNQSI